MKKSTALLGKIFIVLICVGVIYSHVHISSALGDPATTVAPDKNLTATEQTCADGSVTTMGTYCALAPLPGFSKVIDEGVSDKTLGSFTLASYIRTLVRVAIGVIGVLAVVMIVVSGVQYMGSGMVTEKEAAKQQLTGAVFGLILAISSVLILRTINPNLTNIELSIVTDGKWCAENATAITSIRAKVQAGTKLSESEQSILNKANSSCAVSEANGVEIPDALLTEYAKSTGSGTNIDIGNATGASVELGEQTIKNRCGDLTSVNNMDAEFKSAASQAGISCNLLKATYVLESSCGKNLSSKGNSAVGVLQQEMSSVNQVNQVFKKNYTSADRSNKQKAAEIGAYYHKFIQSAGCDTKSKTNVCDASQAKYEFAAYNGGPGANRQSKDCSSPQTAWECTVNQGTYSITQKYAIGGTSILMYFSKNNSGC